MFRRRTARNRGPAFYVRNAAVNETDFFSADLLDDILPVYFFSYVDTDNHVYAFDLRSLHTLIYRSRVHGEIATNPFTRNSIPAHVIKRVEQCIARLRKAELPTEWSPLEPPTPEQQWRMKVVDLFAIIDELNYYSSPDWFIHLTREGHVTFYKELHALWTHRAGLSMTQKNAIVPRFNTRLFRHPPWALRDQSLESLHKLNMTSIQLLVTSAADKNDRILGAMYVISALTLVSAQARAAYPWLYDSVFTDDRRGEEPQRFNLRNILGIDWIHDLLPPLLLPPPAEGGGGGGL
jgi:hypothetical protein